jgi:hypothetical protein
MQSSPLPCYLISLGPKYPRQHPILVKMLLPKFRYEEQPPEMLRGAHYISSCDVGLSEKSQTVCLLSDVLGRQQTPW